MTINATMTRIGQLEAYLAEPDGGSRAGLLLLPMITGIAEQVRTFAHQFAEAGLTTLCWDPFHGANSETHPVEELHAKLAEVDDATAIGEQRSLLEHLLDERGVDKAGTIGYCLGGRFTFLLAATDPRVASVVAFHPTVPEQPAPNHSMDPFDAVRRIQAPVMMHYPGQDHLVSRESFRKLQDGLQARENADTIVHLYPRAGHGFSDTSRNGGEANEAAYARAWPQTIAFLRETLR